MPHITSEHGKEHLTEELREHFDAIGPNGVEHDLFNKNYSNPEKRAAALYWLRELRWKSDAQATRRFRIVAWLAGLSLTAAVAGVLVRLFIR